MLTQSSRPSKISSLEDQLNQRLAHIQKNNTSINALRQQMEQSNTSNHQLQHQVEQLDSNAEKTNGLAELLRAAHKKNKNLAHQNAELVRLKDANKVEKDDYEKVVDDLRKSEQAFKEYKIHQKSSDQQELTASRRYDAQLRRLQDEHRTRRVESEIEMNRKIGEKTDQLTSLVRENNTQKEEINRLLQEKQDKIDQIAQVNQANLDEAAEQRRMNKRRKQLKDRLNE